MLSEARKRANTKYNKKAYETILYRTRRDGDITREAIQEAAAGAGLSVNEFITEAIREKMNRGPENIPEVEHIPFYD